ncbi:MAG: DNA-protecting protein DprA [Thioclava marina]|uniref:DNA-processing protein DprA n=1 Tax=Thioclava marina TaxID=1915077 RepID=UPI001994D9B9|nr:DNA-processing protein DprA [Thioclava marina]MBC7146191.1 DNA-protecting protein DprA [Thioclava marina]
METDLFSYPTPFTPPTTEEDELSVLRLIRSRRVGPTTFHRLIGEHGSARAALEALPEVARAAGVSDYATCTEAQARAELKAGKRAGARLICFGAADYPENLSGIDDAPPVLWALGRTELLTRPMVAIVGARNASSLGLRMARKLAEGLGEAGICVVSGLARGIDAAAHEAALASGTIGVQAGGIDVIYPPENTDLARQMAETGLRLSEAPPGIQPQARHFPARNRIISGLSAGVVVVEAAPKSGSLITARDALDQGREVMAVPGHPMDGRAGGCNLLIRDGAVLVRGAEDVLAALDAVRMPEKEKPASGCMPPEPLPRSAPSEAALAAKILDRLGPSPTAEDQVIRDLGLGAAAFSRALTALEIEGRIERHRGGMISRLA